MIVESFYKHVCCVVVLSRLAYIGDDLVYSANGKTHTTTQRHAEIVRSRSSSQNNISKTCSMKYTSHSHKDSPHMQTGTEEANNNRLAAP